MSSENGFPLGKRITLHRTPIVKKQVEENLKPLKLHMANKIRAQNHYYEKSEQSPLLRNFKFENKLSVHERLGINRRRTMAFDFSTHNGIIRNKHYKKKKNNKGIIKYKKRNNMPKNLAQLRLQQIRQQFYNEALPVSSRIRLRRNYPQARPFNCTVEVNNRNVCNESTKSHSVRGSLNPILQEEIRVLQSQNVVEPNFIPNEPIYIAGYGVTSITINHRFATLP